MTRDDPSSQAFQPAEPFLSVLRVILLLLVAPIVALFAALNKYAREDRKTHSLVALAFVIVLAVITSVDHFNGDIVRAKGVR